MLRLIIVVREISSMQRLGFSFQAGVVQGVKKGLYSSLDK